MNNAVEKIATRILLIPLSVSVFFLFFFDYRIRFVLFELSINLPPFPVHDSCKEICQIALVLVRYVCEGYIELSGFVHKSLPFAHWEELYVFNKL